jgi:radial spoke head protein 3
VLLSKTVEQACLEVEEEHELEEIRKFKTDYRKRQEDLRADWEDEVKREIQRIKQKNKILNKARIRREQQLKTMQKL